MNKRVSEIIKIEEVRKWKSEHTITITAGTGAGKSYFIKNILYAFAEKKHKKILMLIHRSCCVNQFREELIRDKKADIIDVKTYQSLEFHELKQMGNDLSKYQYIVCDEFHYFMSDASFNKITDISLNLILSQSNAVKIFMSATGDYMKKYLNNIKKIDTVDYILPIAHENIKQLTFFNKDETLYEFAKECIEKNDKAIFFIQSAEKAYKLYSKFKKYSLFNCGKQDKHYKKNVKVEKINDMLKKEKFNENILITTTVMDAGVNICDTDLKHIVVDVKDVGSLIQCIGRKRQQNDKDTVNVYIKTITNNELGGMKTQLKNKIEMSEYARKHTVKETLEKYKRQKDISDIIYDDTVAEDDKCTKKINEMRYFKCKTDIGTIENMLWFGKYGYCKYMTNLLGFYDEDTGEYSYRIIEEEYNNNQLEEYLKEIVGQRLYKSDQNKLKKAFNEYGLKARTLGINTLNGYLKDNNMSYMIISKRVRKNNKLSTIWMTEQLEINE